MHGLSQLFVVKIVTQIIKNVIIGILIKIVDDGWIKEWWNAIWANRLFRKSQKKVKFCFMWRIQKKFKERLNH